MCVGGHFLTPAVMAQTIMTLKTLEERPELTNDNIPTDIFKVIFGFTDKLTRSYYSTQLTSQQIYRYAFSLEHYVEDANSKAHPEEDHFTRKEIFLTRIKADDIISKLYKLSKCDERVSSSLKREIESGSHRTTKRTCVGSEPESILSSPGSQVPMIRFHLTRQGSTATPGVIVVGSGDNQSVEMLFFLYLTQANDSIGKYTIMTLSSLERI